MMGLSFSLNVFTSFIYKINIKIRFCVIISLLFFPDLFSQEFVLSGMVYNKTTNQPINSVSVHDRTSLTGIITDNRGAFRISLSTGKHQIAFSCIGFERIDTIIDLNDNKELQIYLNPLSYKMAEITITSDARQNNVTSLQMGAFTLSNKEMKAMPSIMGEIDPLRLLQLTPGIQSGLTGGVGFYVRGGGVDQNLVLYDNTIIYNPGHLLGIFSVFNPELIKDVSIIKSGIPPQYGGKLSSVIKLNSYYGNRDSVKIAGSIGLISSRVSIGGPLFRKKGTFIFGARRTYLDFIVKPLMTLLVKNSSVLNKENKYNFHDFNLGASLKLTKKDNILFSAYYGRDQYRIGQAGIKQKNFIDWGNSMAALHWLHNINENIYLKTNISWTRYDFNLRGSQAEYFFRLYSSVEDLSIKNELSLKNKRGSMITGFEFIDHNFVPNRINARASDLILNFAQFGNMHAIEGGLFIYDEYEVSSRLALSGGLRLSFFDHRGPYTETVKNSSGQITDTIFYPRGESLNFHFNPEPRLTMKYQINNNSSLKASYMKLVQYIHLATSGSVSLPADIWIPTIADIKPLYGDQVSVGYFTNFRNNSFELSTEVYFKKMANKLEFLRGIVNSSIDHNLNENIAVGNGQAYGIEFYLSKKVGNLTGWLSYALSRTEQKFDNINEGLIYPAKYDRRHDISLTMTKQFNDKWSGSAVFIYVSGNAFTMPVGRYIIQGNIINQYGKVNDFRMPSNHRLDISMMRKLKTMGRLSSELAFSIYNVYNRANPYYIYYEIDGDIEKYSLEIKAVKVCLLPIIPSISWNFKF